jgi:hypothetical protein
VLGLGGALAILLFLTGKGPGRRLICLVLALSFLVLSSLTFSRGGLYNAAVMSFLAILHSMRNSRGRLAAMALLLLLGLAGGYLIFPRLNAFTGGMIQQRFIQLDPTLRLEIARADLEVWFANPVFGAGPGLSKVSRLELHGYEVAAHTEYSRALAEHGIAGLMALLVLLGMAARGYVRAPTVEAQIWIAALLAWPLMEMTHAAMRIAAISLMLGLAMVRWKVEDDVPPNPGKI